MKHILIAATTATVASLACIGSAAAQWSTDTASEREAEPADGELDFLELAAAEEGASTSNAEARSSEGARAGDAPAKTESTADRNPMLESSSASAPASAAADAPLATLPVAERPTAEPATAAPKRRSRQLEEIVVTAQRREENLQEVPISITVFSQEQLSNANITNSADLATYTPSLTTNNRFGSENASFAIRGFTQDLRTTASVGVYFAEVVAPRGQSLQTSGDGAGPGTLFDLQNVQVLKGPQGTLFGRNTTGGAVLIVPQKPQDEWGGYIEASTGDYDAKRLQVVTNVPVNDAFRLRLGLDHHEREGYLRNFTRIGTDYFGDVNYTAVRLSTVWDLSENLENYTILSFVDSETPGNTSALFACNPRPTPSSSLTGDSCRRQLAEQEAQGQNGFYDLSNTVEEPLTHIREKRLINTTSWQLSDALTFKNILAYAHLYTVNSSEVSGTRFHAIYDPAPHRYFKIGLTVANPDFPVTSQETWVEEVQLQGNAFEGRLDWQTGAYYEESKPDGFSGNNSATLLSCDPGSIAKQPSEWDCMDAAGGSLGSVRIFAFQTTYSSRAVYAQGTYDITDPLSVTTGLRYTWDRTEGQSRIVRYGYAGTVQRPPQVFESSPSATSEAVTGLVNLEWKPWDEVMLYAKYARGYRQGSINMAADQGLDTFDPEQVDTYELGGKTSFDGWIPGRFNFAVFYNDFKDMQLQTGYISNNVGATTAIFNAGKAKITGAELEAYFQLLDSLSLNLSYSRLDTELVEQEDQRERLRQSGGLLAGATATPIANVGDSLPYAPDQTYVATLKWELPLPERLGEMYISGTSVHIGKQRATASSSSPYDEIASYNLLNLNLGWTRLLQSPLDLSLFATNVLDEEYVTFYHGSYNSQGFESRKVGLPRMIGARLKYNF